MNEGTPSISNVLNDISDENLKTIVDRVDRSVKRYDYEAEENRLL